MSYRPEPEDLGRTAVPKARAARGLLVSFIDAIDEIVHLELAGAAGDVARLTADDAARLLGRLDGLLLRLEHPRPAA